ncbi:unnamed protein product [Rotaria sordida]|uniref:F-box domain-containing protein n=1 Tax=Rotaria sordida TaxID=392033 RepID=A0A814WYC7_9BILA|nr:unnamed protein product [Rotaria sordida]
MNIVELLDLPDELILFIMKKVNPQVLLLCSAINIGNKRFEQLAFDTCYAIDLTFDYSRAPYKLLMEQFYSNVLPRVIYNIKSLTINCYHISSIKRFMKNNCNATLPNLMHVKILVGARHGKTSMPITIGNSLMFYPDMRTPLFTTVPQFILSPHKMIGEKIITFCRLPFMHAAQSVELDENLVSYEIFANNQPYFDQLKQVTHLCISLWGFHQCVHLLVHMGSQLHSFTVTIGKVYDKKPDFISKVRSISCPNLKKMTMIMYRNFNNYEQCTSVLQRLSNVEYLTLLLAIDQDGIRPSHFIDGSILEKKILQYLPRLCQFNYHIRSILKNTFHITINQIRQSFLKHEQSFDCVLDHFKNKYGQCQIYSLPFIGSRLDFISNRFPLFDIKNTFSNVTILLLFDDVKPFESIFFERVARALSRLRTLEIINQLEQQEKTTTQKTNIDFPHLAVLILYDIHIDYAEEFLCQIHLPALIELAINKDILLKIISQNQQQARHNCSKVARLLTSKSSHQSVDTIRNFFPQADYCE